MFDRENNRNEKPVLTCEWCPFEDRSVVLMSFPPQYRCIITGKSHRGIDLCDVTSDEMENYLHA